MNEWESLAIVLVLCATLSILTFRFGLLTRSGAIASFVVGMIIGGLGSIAWLFTLIVFTFLGFIVTKFKFQAKEAKGLQEGKKGERTYKNILANGLVPVLVAIVSFATGNQDDLLAGVVYLSAISVAAADTTASELGVLSPDTYLITNLKRVPPGTDGGVSVYGTLCCILASVFATLVGWLVMFPNDLVNPFILIPMTMGVFGCMVDSLIGATLERKGHVTKLGNNILSMLAGTVLGFGLILLL